MERKTTDGPVRNRERTMQKLLDAVGEVIRTEGYTKLGINHIARVAGVDKKLIYRYFGTVNQLIERYVREKDYWLGMKWDVAALMEQHRADHGERLAHHLLTEFMDYLQDSPEMCRMILWEISEKSKLMREVSDIRESIGDDLFALTDPLFDGSGVDLRAVYAILTSGAYYLSLRSNACGGTFCGIHFSTPEGKLRVTQAMHQMVDWSFAKAISGTRSA